MQHQAFDGFQVQYQRRHWEQSPETYSMDADNRGRPLHELVASIQIADAVDAQELSKQYGNKSRKGEKRIAMFKKLKDAGLMNFTPSDFDNRDSWKLYLYEVAAPYFMEQGHKSNAVSRNYCSELMSTLSKWMGLHAVNPNVIHHFDSFRRQDIWDMLGTDAALKTSVRKKTERKISEKMQHALADRIKELYENPEPTLINQDNSTDTKTVYHHREAILSVRAAYMIARNITARSGEISKMKVGQIDFDEMMIWKDITKGSSSSFGDKPDEPLWPQTAQAVKEYLESRKESLQQPDANLFGRIDKVWKNLCKDAFGDKWVKGMGLHLFSRNEGLKILHKNNASISELQATSGANIETVNKYVMGWDDEDARHSANKLKHKILTKQGLLLEEVKQIEADADLRSLMLSLKMDAMETVGEMTGEYVKVADPALFSARVGHDGKIKSTPVVMARQGRFELPR